MFKKILVANRGDIAVRVIRAAREMRIPTVAVFSQADMDSLPVRLADEAVCIGPPERKGSYLNAPNILSAAVITGCDAVHPGIGFLAEVASFAEMCDAIGLKYIGPPVKAIEMMGDKIEARATMERAGVPIVPGTNVALRDPLEAAKIAAKIGFPVMIKAAGGGGGRGIRVVQNEEEFPKILKMAQVEAESSFGNPDVYIEKFIDTFRHIEVQILADEHGTVLHLGERDCSLQTQRYQKMVEEAPAPHLPAAVRKRICDAAVRAARAAGYTNAGTVEFIVAPDGTFYFMEMNTRLQIEHPITEMVTGIDLVKQQIRIAAGEKLPFAQRDIQWNGHAIEVRLTARDPDRDFAPSAGTHPLPAPPRRPRRPRGHARLLRLRGPPLLRLHARQDHRLGRGPATAPSPGCSAPWTKWRSPASRPTSSTTSASSPTPSSARATSTPSSS